MVKYLQLGFDRNRAWPWPKTDFDRVCDAAYGEGGWCSECCRPLTDRPRNMVLMSGGKPVKGVWVPYFWYDSWCVDRATFDSFPFASEFATGAVTWRGGDGGDAVHLVIPVYSQPLFDPAELERRTVERHGRAGRECPVCGAWRWMPLGFRSTLPDPVVSIEGADSPPAIASPEIFGDGGKTFREVFFREDVAAALQAAQRGVKPTGVSTR
jgi:hypothetical protein